MTRAASLVLIVGLVATVGCGPMPTPTTPAPPAPAVPPTTPASPSDDEARETAKKNLKTIGLAVYKYESSRVQFPSSSTTRDGNGLSWRVQILPYLGKEEGELFAKFRPAEPWDSPHNKTLIDQMPAVFASPGKPAEKGHTYLRGFVGPRAFFPVNPLSKDTVTAVNVDPTQGRRITSVSDGTSNTLMAAEAAEAVIWTKPDELRYDEFADGKKPLPKLGGVFADGFHGLMADTQVLFFPNPLVNDDLLRKTILTNDTTRETTAEDHLLLNPIRQVNKVELHKPLAPERPSPSSTKK